MAGRCWMAVTLCLLLFDGNSLAAVDQNQLAPIVDQILNMYTPSYVGSNGVRRNPMFSLAVTIPYDEDTKKYDISQLDDGSSVTGKILNCEVYTSPRVVAATVLKWPEVLKQCPDGPVQWPDVVTKCPGVNTWADVKNQCPGVVKGELKGRADHAEYRTLQRINTLDSKDYKSHLLLFYVLASPCDQRCTNEENNLNILESIQDIKNWSNYAVVFSNIFKPRSGHVIPTERLQGALERLGGSIGLHNIFRCNKQDGSMHCTSCSSDNQVAHSCVSDETMAGPSPSQPPTPSTGSQDGVDNGNENEDEGAPSSRGGLDNSNDNSVIPNGGAPPSEGGPENDMENDIIPNGGAPPSQGGKCRGMKRRKGCNGRGMRRHKGGKGRGMRGRKGGKGRGMRGRKGGKGRGMRGRKGGKGRGMRQRKGAKGRGMRRRKGEMAEE
ncbi:uncharacterized protein AB9X84_006680 [Acanthopagrus schlegelii]